MPYEGSYVWRLRQKVGHDKIIAPGVCAIILDRRERVLLEHRRDFNVWALPGGTSELGETVMEALRREVREETGLLVESAELIGLYTAPSYDVNYPNGDQLQQFTATFHVSRWSGELSHDAEESYGVAWWPLAELPALPLVHRDQLADFRNWQGSVILR